LKFLSNEVDAFQNIADRILEQPHPYFKHYCKLRYGYKNTSEMRFNVGKKNERIYCHEMLNKHGELCVIMSRFFGKKTSEGIDKKIKPIINAVEDYEYKINYNGL